MADNISYSDFTYFEITNYDEEEPENINRPEWIDRFENYGVSRLETIDTETKADEYVKDIFEKIDKWEIISIYYNIQLKKIKKYLSRLKKSKEYQLGKGLEETKINNNIMNNNDSILYEMLMYADTIHDFKTMDSFNIDIFFIEKRDIFPIDITIEILLNEENFIEYLSKKRKLEFKSKTIDNPFYTFSINTYNIKKKCSEKLKITFEELYCSNYQSTEMRSKNKNAKTLSVDLWELIIPN